MSEVGKNEIKKKRTFLSVIKKGIFTAVTRKRGNIFGGKKRIVGCSIIHTKSGSSLVPAVH